jgi:hypothetical protein
MRLSRDRRYLLSVAAAVVIGSVATASMVAFVTPGAVRDVGIVASWLASIVCWPYVAWLWIRLPGPGDVPNRAYAEFSRIIERGESLRRRLRALREPTDQDQVRWRILCDDWWEESVQVIRQAAAERLIPNGVDIVWVKNQAWLASGVPDWVATTVNEFGVRIDQLDDLRSSTR